MIPLFNLVSKVVLSEKMKEDLCNQREIGQNLSETFVQERIKSGKVNFWFHMKRWKLLTWKTNAKVLKVSTKEKVVELREDRSLFARMMMVYKSRPEINIKETVSQYEFSLVPRSFVAADVSMLHCSSKSVLLAILEKLNGENNDQNDATTGMSAPQIKVTILDGMAELQSLGKPEWIKNCSQLADHLNSRIYQKHAHSDELRLVFGRYDLPLFLKAALREIRQGSQDPVYYKITDTTQIARVPMKKLLSHTRTKMELTGYLAEKTIQHAMRHGKRLVVAWGCECLATHKDVTGSP